MSVLRSSAPRLRKLDRQLEHAASYAEWLELAKEHDRLTGADEWRASDDSDLLHVPEIRRSIATLRAMREAGETWPLTKKLQELLFAIRVNSPTPSSTTARRAARSMW
jgi:TAG lipase / steryl ester hydrolase / phospholipase A2 / LPA acyltransferase